MPLFDNIRKQGEQLAQKAEALGFLPKKKKGEEPKVQGQAHPVTPEQAQLATQAQGATQALPAQSVMPVTPDPAQQVISLMDSESEASMQATQDGINAKTSVPEPVVDLATGQMTDEIISPKSPAQLGLSTATSSQPTAPLMLNSRGPDAEKIKQSIAAERQSMAIRGAPVPASSGTTTKRIKLFGRGKESDQDITAPNYANTQRQKLYGDIQDLRTLTARHALERSGREFDPNKSIEEQLSGIPAAAVILTMREMPTPAYVTEAQKLYQTAVAQYGYDLSLLKEAAKNDAALQESMNTVAQWHSAAHQNEIAARNVGLSARAYAGGDVITLGGARGYQFAAASTKERASFMQQTAEQTSKQIKSFIDAVEKGEDMSGFSDNVGQTLYNQMTTGLIDANTGTNYLLDWFSNEQSRTTFDRRLASRLKSLGMNDQAITTAVAIQHIPGLKQDVMQLARNNRVGKAYDMPSVAGKALNAIFNSEDLENIMQITEALEAARTGDALMELEIRSDSFQATRAAMGPKGNGLAEAFKDYKLIADCADMDGSNNPVERIKAADRLYDRMAESKRADERIAGSVLKEGFGFSDIKDNMELIRSDDAMRRSKLVGDVITASEHFANTFRQYEGLRPQLEKRDNMAKFIEEHKDWDKRKLFDELMQNGLLTASAEKYRDLIEAVLIDRGRSSTKKADEIIENLSREAFQAARDSKFRIPFSEQQFQKMKDYQQTYGLMPAMKTKDGNQYYFETTPRQLALYSIMDQITPVIMQAMADGKRLTTGDIRSVLTAVPENIAMYEALCGASLEKVVQSYVSSLHSKQVFQNQAAMLGHLQQAQAQAQAQSAKAQMRGK